MQRSILLFENSIKSATTRKTYLYYLDNFLKFYHIKDYDSLAGIDVEKAQIMVEDYVMHLKNVNSPNYISLPLSSIKAFFDCNDVDLRWAKIKRLMPARIKKTGREAWLTSEVAKMLTFTKELRTKTLIHFIASSGVRIGALERIKMKHIKQIEDCKSVLVYEGSIEEYTTFLTPEASLIFDEYILQRESDGEKIIPDTPAFRSTYRLKYEKVKPSTTLALKEIIRTLILKSGLRINQIKTGKRYNKQADHGFRKRWNTCMKTVPSMNISLAEKMMGHSVTVIQDNVYLDPSIDQLFTEFKKAIPELSVDGSARKQAQLDIKELENSVLQKKVNDIEKLKQDLTWSKIEFAEMIDNAIEDPQEFKKLIDRLREQKYD